MDETRDPSRSARIPRLLRRWSHEPLLHFLLLGTGVFVLHGLSESASGARAETDRRIVIDPAFERALSEEHARTTGAPPDAARRRALVRRFAREEALYREARRLGLDRGDAIVRQRLVQKMRLVLEAGAEPPEPDDAQLEAHLADHAERYAEPPRLSFTHVFFDAERRGREGAERAARRLHRELQRRESGQGDAADRGDPFLHGRSFVRHAPSRIERTFGPGFAEAARAAPLERWSQPIGSRYGSHLVRVTDRLEGGVPPLAQVRDRVRRDWRADQQQRVTERAIEELVERYRLVRAEGAEREEPL